MTEIAEQHGGEKADHPGGDRDHRQPRRQPIDVEERAAVFLFIDYAERLDDRARCPHRAVDRKGQRDDEAEPGLRRGGSGDVGELILDQPGSIGGHEIDDGLHMRGDSRGISDKAISHHHGAEQRNERQEGVEGDARRHQRQVVIAVHHVDAREDRSPGAPRMMPRRFGFNPWNGGWIDFRYGFRQRGPPLSLVDSITTGPGAGSVAAADLAEFQTGGSESTVRSFP